MDRRAKLGGLALFGGHLGGQRLAAEYERLHCARSGAPGEHFLDEFRGVRFGRSGRPDDVQGVTEDDIVAVARG